MVGKQNWKALAIYSAAVAIFATSASLLLAANIGWKINTVLQNGFIAPGPKGDNWRGIGALNPYPTYTSLCNAFVAAGATKANISLATINAATGAVTNVNCVVGSALALNPAFGIRIRITGVTAPASPANIVLVGASGSSGDSVAFRDVNSPEPNIHEGITIFGGFVAPGPKGDNWLMVPPTTTLTKASEVCTHLGFVLATGANIGRITSATGVTTSHTCGLAANNFSLVIGESIRIRKTTPGNVVGAPEKQGAPEKKVVWPEF